MISKLLAKYASTGTLVHIRHTQLRGLIAGFALVAFLVLAISAYSFVSSRFIQADLDTILNSQVRRIDLLRKLELISQKRVRLMYETVQSSDAFVQDDKVQELGVEARNFIAVMNALRTSPALTEADARQIEQLGALSAQSQQQMLTTIDLALAGKRTEANQHLFNQIYLAQTSVLSTISTLIGHYQEQMAEIHTRAYQRSLQQQQVLFVGGGLAILLTLLIGWRVWKLMQHMLDGLQDAQQALLDQASHTRAILDNMQGGVITIDEAGIIQSFNKASEKIFGYTSAETKDCAAGMLLPNTYSDVLNNKLKADLPTGIKDFIGISRELIAMRKDGSLFPIEIMVSEISHNGLPVYVCLLQDITQRKRVEQSLIAARDEAFRANAAKSLFLSSMSHELRTPLNSILGFSQLMLMEDALSGEQREFCEQISRAGEHLLKLINEVLDLSRIESGKLDLAIQAVEVYPLVHECMKLVETQASKRHVSLQQACNVDVAVQADHMRLKQVLLNLLSNAIKYNREGGSVKLSVDPAEHGKICIMVTDTGPGIPKERMPDLFLPFNRLGAESGNIEGTGIGLSISRNIVEKMGGSIQVVSEVGVGSTFWIELPAAA